MLASWHGFEAAMCGIPLEASHFLPLLVDADALGCEPNIGIVPQPVMFQKHSSKLLKHASGMHVSPATAPQQHLGLLQKVQVNRCLCRKVVTPVFPTCVVQMQAMSFECVHVYRIDA